MPVCTKPVSVMVLCAALLWGCTESKDNTSESPPDTSATSVDANHVDATQGQQDIALPDVVAPPADAGQEDATVSPDEGASRGKDTGSIDDVGSSDEDVLPKEDAIDEPDTAEPSDTPVAPDTDDSEDTSPSEDVTEDTSPQDVGPADVGAVTDAEVPSEDVSAQDVDVAPKDSAPVDAGPPVCNPPLSLLPAKTSASPMMMKVLQASGGSGQYEFSLKDDSTGAKVNPVSGAYQAGPKVGVTDVLVLHDKTCVGEATASIEVVSLLKVSPVSVTVPPGACVPISVTGGSGNYSYQFNVNNSQASVDKNGGYIAGMVDGFDVVRVTDKETGQYDHVIVVIQQGAGITMVPGRITLPLGSTFVAPVAGGSEIVGLEVTGTEGVVSVSCDVIVAEKPGVTTITAVDQFVGCTGVNADQLLSAAATVEVVDALDIVSERPAAGGNAYFKNAGDLNGDGYVDALYANKLLPFGAHASGLIQVFAGTADGLNPKPARVLTSTVRSGKFGQTMTLGDFNADGVSDLAVGAPGYGFVRSHLYVYYGVKNDFFPPQPSKIIKGKSGYGIGFGASVAACDFNGDGVDDLAVGRSSCSNSDLTVGPDGIEVSDTAAQGCFKLFLGGAEGISDWPTAIHYGWMPTPDGKWVAKNVGLGHRLTAGDLNGDGLCDLAFRAGVHTYGKDKGSAIGIYAGVAPKGEHPGGLTLYPVAAYADVAQAGSMLSGVTAVQDVNGDKKQELLIHLSQGGLALLAGAEFSSKEPMEMGQLPYRLIEKQADGSTKHSAVKGVAVWADYHLDKDTWVGFGPARIGDVNQDGEVDLLVLNTSYNKCVFDLYTGSEDTPWPSAEPSYSYKYTFKKQAYTGLALLEDYNKDGLLEWLSFDSAISDYGLGVGRPAILSGGVAFKNPEDGEVEDPDAHQPKLLEFPGKRSNTEIGKSMAIVGDLDGDGLSELAVGTGTNTLNSSASMGQVFVYRGTAGGFEKKPAVELSNHPGHGKWTYFAGRILPLPDFDADGRSDFLATGGISNAYYPTKEFSMSDTCKALVESNKGGSGALIYRGQKAPLTNKYWPSFAVVAHGVQSSAGTHGGFDYNGDGYSDFVMSTNGWLQPDNGGYVRFFNGRPYTGDGKMQVICEPDFTLEGELGVYHKLGRLVVGIGDLNGDDCDEFAVRSYPNNYTSQHRLHVFFGWGEACKYKTPHFVAFSGVVDRVVGNGDLDGDGIPDMVVSYHSLKVGIDKEEKGGVWFIPGKRILSLPAEPHVTGQKPKNVTGKVAADAEGIYVLKGAVAGEQFGHSLAMLPKLGGNGRAALAVGAPLGNASGVPKTGQVYIYKMKDSGLGFDVKPIAVVGGENHPFVDPDYPFSTSFPRIGGRLGNNLSVGLQGSNVVMSIGTPLATPSGQTSAVDNGTVYTLSWPLKE